jgi:hypothetical protein
MLKLKSLLIILILITSSFVFSINIIYSPDNFGSFNQEILVDDDGENIEPAIDNPASSRGGGQQSFAPTQQNVNHGGSWLDTFDDISGVSAIDTSVKYDNGKLRIDTPGYVENGNMEKGTLNQQPPKWTKDTYETGSASFVHYINLRNWWYFEGSMSTYVESRAQVSSGTGAGSWTNLTMEDYVDASDANSVVVHMSNIIREKSYGWGWNCHIRMVMTDGTNTTSPISLYWNGESGGTHNYDSWTTGPDSNRWYKYSEPIPASIYKKHMKVWLNFIAGCWTPSGTYVKISAYVDYIHFVTQVGRVISDPIDLPTGMKWDTLVVNKTQPDFVYNEVTILRASNNQRIPGSLKYNDDGEFDISYIDSSVYTSIKLRIQIDRFQPVYCTLYYWGVSWNASSAWRDTFYYETKVDSVSYVDILDGTAHFNNSDTFQSSQIIFPYGFYYDTLIINKTESPGCYLNITVLDGVTDIPIRSFENLTSESIDISKIDPHTHPSLKLNATCETNATQTVELNYWSLNWTLNIPPIFNLIESVSKLNRTEPARFIMTLTDVNDPYWNLTLKAEYKAPSDMSWQTLYCTTPFFNVTHWEFNFTPPAVAELGFYEFKFTYNDSFSIFHVYPTSVYIEVLNNKPSLTGISLSANTVYRTNKINIFVDAFDIERSEEQLGIEFKYRSPKDAKWQTTYLSNQQYLSNKWQVDFLPPNTADLGQYIFKILCNDTDCNVSTNVYATVLNNIPNILNIELSDSKVNRTDTIKIHIDVSDTEVAIAQLNVKVKYKSPKDLFWESDYIFNKKFESGSWEAEFTPPNTADLGDYTFRIICNDSDCEVFQEENVLVLNNIPSIWNVYSTSYLLKRTESVKIVIDTSDVEIPKHMLDIKVKYRSPEDSVWESDYVHELSFAGGHWEAEFTPGKNADLGNYIFNISCNDTDCEVFELIDITVENNIPTQPVIELTPESPTTLDNLEIKLIDVIDIETPKDKMEIWYHWFKNGLQQFEFDNVTQLPYSSTAKYEKWLCRVIVFDGDDFGPSSELDVKILNSAPIVSEPIGSLILKEDHLDDSSINLNKIFYDADNDTLAFTCSGQSNLKIEIDQESGHVTLTPPPNWFGSENLVFNAYDNEADASERISVIVEPQNDPPYLTKAGTVEVKSPTQLLDFSVHEGSWINLTFVAADIDGDTVSISTNRTDFIGIDDIDVMTFEINVLMFHPDNSHVGYIPINLTLSDLNGSLVHYDLKIQVINVNNPPTIEITHPADGTHFEEGQALEFKCGYSDIDLSIPESDESHYFTVHSNLSSEPLGEGPNTTFMKGIILEPGYHEITISVKDKDGLTAEHSISIVVDEKPEPEEESTTADISDVGNNLWWIILVVILIIIIVIVLVIVNKRRRPRETKAELLPPGKERPALPGTFVAKPGAIAHPRSYPALQHLVRKPGQ